LAEVSVYDGARPLGFVWKTRDGFDAVRPGGSYIATFRNQADAVVAVRQGGAR
jgi:hypothetical protein